MVLKWIVYVLLVLAAAIEVWKAYRKRPRRRRDWGIWSLGFAAGVLLLLAAFLQIPSSWEHKVLEALQAQRETQEQHGEKLDSLGDGQREIVCNLDTLKNWVSQLPGRCVDTVYLDTVIEYVECLEAAATVLRRGLDSGVVLIGRGMYPLAITHLNYAILAAQDDSSRAEAYYFRGVSVSLWAVSLERETESDTVRTLYELAIISYDSSLALRHGSDKAWYNRGLAFAKLGRHDEAVVSYDSALVYNHDKHDAWNNRGVSLGILGDYEAALASLDTSLRYKHDNASAWAARCGALFELNRMDLAKESCDSALKYDPDHGPATFFRDLIRDEQHR